MDDEMDDRRPVIPDDMVNPVMIATRNGPIPVVTSDQQTDEQRYGGGWGGRPYGGGWGGRPYGGGWGGGGWGGGRPYGGWGGGRPYYGGRW